MTDQQHWSDVADRLVNGDDVPRPDVRAAVRTSLAELAALAPGRSVEVRVPPFAAVQVVAGVRHRRGTPPAVVEMAPGVWLALARGRLTWTQAVVDGSVRASGSRADLSTWLPLNGQSTEGPRPTGPEI